MVIRISGFYFLGYFFIVYMSCVYMQDNTFYWIPDKHGAIV